MKAAFMSDLHGYLPEFNEKVDVVCICGDIVPLHIQNDTIKSVVWFTGQFVPWAMNLNCQKVIFVAGNHDHFLERIVKDYFSNTIFSDDKKYQESVASEVIKEKLMLPRKIVYLQDDLYTYNHKTFYGSPWIPDLSMWAFYKNHEDLQEVFKHVPDECDVLVTHAPGIEDNMGTSLWISGMPMYGCKELTDRVNETQIKFWAAGHVHTGNHKEGLLSNGVTRIVNVSLKDEGYDVRFEPYVVEI